MKTIEIAQDIQQARSGSYYVLAAGLKVLCKGAGYRSGEGAAYDYLPAAEFAAGSILVGARGSYRVTCVGKVYDDTVEVGLIDEDRSDSGFRRTGTRTEQQQRIYVEQL